MRQWKDSLTFGINNHWTFSLFSLLLKEMGPVTLKIK